MQQKRHTLIKKKTLFYPYHKTIKITIYVWNDFGNNKNNNNLLRIVSQPDVVSP